MSIQTEINRIITAVSAAHEKVSEKGGTTARPYLVENLEGAIDTIPIGVQLPTLANPGKASDALSGKEFIDGSGNKVTGTIATKTASNLTASGATVTVPAGYYASQATKSVATATQATPSISVSSAGLITASATQSAGYVEAGTKSATNQLITQGAQTITPGTADKTIASGRYLTGTQTIKGDSNLVAENIKSGISIFGVAGSMKPGAELNFEVVGGDSKPSNPKENTIWVTTSTAITGWGFGALTERPASPASGMVWFQTTDASNVKFNALKENALYAYPSDAYQYVNRSWVPRTAKTYQGGKWVDWWNGMLYSYGNQFEEATGGLEIKKIDNIVGGTLTFGSNYFTVKGTASTVSAAASPRSLSPNILSQYSSVRVNVKSKSGSAYIRVFSSLTPQEVAAEKTISGSGEYWLSLSGINARYVATCSFQGTLEVYEFELVK